MNYQERISALNSFKSSISNGEIEDSAASFSTDISGWSGGETAKNGYDGYIAKVKTDTSEAVSKKADFISSIDERISSIQSKFDTEYTMYSAQMNFVYDKDASKRIEKKQAFYNSLKIDSSVKAKLAQNIN